jgi:hypothetical protein
VIPTNHEGVLASKSSGQGTQQLQDLLGRRFYKPGVIAVFCLLGVPVGTLLYGLNIARRGDRLLGYGLAVVSGLILLFAPFSNGPDLSRVAFYAGIFFAIGIFNLETGPYQLALSRGGQPARWWPPLLGVAGYIIAVAVLMTASDPNTMLADG